MSVFLTIVAGVIFVGIFSFVDDVKVGTNFAFAATPNAVQTADLRVLQKNITTIKSSFLQN